MKFKMAPNSGFAILLRSPWWVSFAIAAVIVLLCGALLPAHLAPFAAVGALPVAVIGCIAGWRQWRAPSAARVAAMHAQLQTWPWHSLARLSRSACAVVALCLKTRCETSIAPTSGTGGRAWNSLFRRWRSGCSRNCAGSN